MPSLIEEFFRLIIDNQIVTGLVVPHINGEVGIHLLGVLSAEGEFSFFIAFFVTAISIIIFDMCIFLLTNYVMKYSNLEVRKSLKSKLLNNVIYTFKIICNKFPRSNLLLLSLIKILPGTRLLIVLFFFFYRPKFTYFLIIDSVITIIWSFILASTGFIVGRGLFQSFSEFKIESFLVYVAVLLIILLFVNKAIKKYILK